MERGNPEMRGEDWGGQAGRGAIPKGEAPIEGSLCTQERRLGTPGGSRGGEAPRQRVPVHAGVKAGDARRVGPLDREIPTRRSRCARRRGLGTHRKA